MNSTAGSNAAQVALPQSPILRWNGMMGTKKRKQTPVQKARPERKILLLRQLFSFCCDNSLSFCSAPDRTKVPSGSSWSKWSENNTFAQLQAQQIALQVLMVPRHYQWIPPEDCKDWGARPSRSRCLASRQTHSCVPLIPGKESAKKWGAGRTPPQGKRI